MTNDNINHNNITMNNHTTSHSNMSSSSATSTPQASATSSFIPSTRWLSLSNKLSNLSLSASWSGHGFPGLSRSSPFYPSVTNPSSVKSIFYDSSPGTSNTGGFIDIFKISPEDIAGQLTLIDLPIFQSISEDEFLSIGWNTARKSILSPNIVSLTRRFNQISFWVIEEVLLSSVNRRFSSGRLGDNNEIFVTEKDTSKSSTATPFVPFTESGSNNGDPSSTNISQHNTYCLLSQSVNVGERGSPKHLKWHSTSSSLQSSPLSASHNYSNGQNGNQHQQSTLDSEAKLRSDIISHFVKVAKKLYDLHNLHSCYAIVSALTSTPIYRLSKTWALVSKKDKAILDKLTALFADESNFENLRAHLAKTDPPCIPYLGMFLRDLVYVDIAHPAPKTTVASSITMSVTSFPASNGIVNGNRDTRSTTATLGMSSRMNKMNAILNNITKYQKSSVYHIERIPALSEYLSSVRYIEELQKFLEEDNFKLSLRLEPPTPSLPDKEKEQLTRSTSSYQSVGSKSTFYVPSAAEELARTSSLPETTIADKATHGTNGCNNSYHPLQQLETSVNNTSTNTEVTADTQEQQLTKPPFVPGHRKTRSLGSQALLQAVGIDLSKPIGHSSPRRGLFGANKPFSLLREDKKVYPSKMNNLSSSDNGPQHPMTFCHHQRRNLIDDSVIEEVPGESEWERSSRSSKASSMVDDGHSISSYSPTPSSRSSTRYRDSTKGEEDRVSCKSTGNMNHNLPSHNRQHHKHATKWNTNDSYKQATTGTDILTSSMESNDEVSEEKLPSITEAGDHEKQTKVSQLSPYPCSQGQANRTNGITSSEDRIRISKEDFPDNHQDSLDGKLPPSFEGYVRRKTLIKEGQKPAFACWIRYWISLRGSALVYYPSRAMKGTSRDRFRETHSKTLNVSEWTAQISVTDADSFTLSSDRGQSNSSRKTVYLFRCSSEEEATMWCKHVSKTNSNVDKKNRRSKCDGGLGNGVALTVSRKVIDDDSKDEESIKHSHRRQMSYLQPPQYSLV